MRLLTGSLIVAAVLAVPASAAAPAGFYDSRVLAPAAAFVAGKPVKVYCSLTRADWTAYRAERGASKSANALTDIGAAETFLESSICRDLRLQLQRRKVDAFDLASAALILVHEGVHQRGLHDEGEVECKAIHELPRVLVRYFRVKAGKQLRALMAQAWESHRDKPAAYQSVC